MLKEYAMVFSIPPTNLWRVMKGLGFFYSLLKQKMKSMQILNMLNGHLVFRIKLPLGKKFHQFWTMQKDLTPSEIELGSPNSKSVMLSTGYAPNSFIMITLNITTLPYPFMLCYAHPCFHMPCFA